MAGDRTLQKAVETLRKDASVHKPGFYRAIVEDIDDPDRLGRVKIRVWAIHGDKNRTKTKALPWAEIAEPGGGGYDYGSFNPPPVGSSVWVGFEGANVDFPVVFGTFRGVPKRNSDNPQVFLTTDGLPPVEKPWLPPDDESETPKDIFDGVHRGDPHPTRRVWQKSFKGHTILVEDGDGKEFLKIIDRAGQVIEMYCPVDKETQQGNKAQRGIRDTTRGDALPHAIMKDRRAMIRIKDLSGQEIVLDSTDQDESITIRSTSRTGSSVNTIEMRSGRGNESITITDSGGDQILLDPNSGQPIRIEDSSGNKILFDKDQGKVVLVSSKISEEQAPQKRSVISGQQEIEVQGDNIQLVHGNKQTNVVNDLTLGVLGNTTLSLGGQVEIIATNQQVGALPLNGKGVKLTLANALLGCDFEVSNLHGDMTLNTKIGDWDISTDLGNIDISTVAGNVQLGTIAGNVTVGTNAGDVTCQTTAGMAALKTLAGITNIDGTTVEVGVLGAAIHPMLRGELVTIPWGIFNAANLLALNTLIPFSKTVEQALKGPPPITSVSQLVGVLLPYFTALNVYLQSVVSAFTGETAAIPLMLSPLRLVD